MVVAASSASGAESAWSRFERTVQQEPLIATEESLATQAPADAGRGGGRGAPPRAVMVGVGIRGKLGLSHGLPLDVLGLLAPAEALRQAVGASSLVVLIADRHAVAAGESPLAVARAAKEVERRLLALRERTGWGALELLRASELHRGSLWRSLAKDTDRAFPSSVPLYARYQVTDVEALHRSRGGVLKVGWSLGAGAGAFADERAFDRLHRQAFGRGARYAYTRPGRTLDENRPRASPYVCRDPARRVLLHPDERPSAKLAGAAEEPAKAARRHLALITRAIKTHVKDLTGDVDDRLRALVAMSGAA